MHATFNIPQSHHGPDWTDSRVLANRLQTIAVVDGNDTVFASIETAMGAACHTVLLLDSDAHAYADIRRLQPSLVVLCISLDNPAPVQLLTMLKMDSKTRSIPVATVVIDNDDDTVDSEDVAAAEAPVSVWVN